MYSKIKTIDSLDNIYAKELNAKNIISTEEYQIYKKQQQKILEDEFNKAENYVFDKVNSFSDKWANLTTEYHSQNATPITGIDHERAKDIIETLTTIPDDFNANPKIVKQQKAKNELVKSGKNIDWALGEAMAYASLLQDGYSVRLSGQDSGRGTFSHRHSILIDSKNESKMFPLNKVTNLKKQI